MSNAIVGLKTRVFYRERLADTTKENYWASDTTNKWLWVGNAKSVPNPMGDPNMVDTSGLEDWIETQIEGRRGATDFAIQLPFAELKKFVDLEGKDLDLFIAYGSKGTGEAGMIGVFATETAAPDEATEDELTCTVTFSLTSKGKLLSGYTVTVTEDAFGYPSTISISAS